MIEQEMPAEESQGQPAPGGQSPQQVQELITGIHSNLIQLKDLLGGVQEIPQEAKAPLDQVLESYKSFVASLAGAVNGNSAAPEAPPQEEPAPPMKPSRVPARTSPLSGGPGMKPAL